MDEIERNQKELAKQKEDRREAGEKELLKAKKELESGEKAFLEGRKHLKLKLQMDKRKLRDKNSN